MARAPFKIVNNYLEGAGENVLFGGPIPRSRIWFRPDIEIRRNHIAKPLTWKAKIRHTRAPLGR